MWCAGGGGVPDPAAGRVLPRQEGPAPLPHQQLRRRHVHHHRADQR